VPHFAIKIRSALLMVAAFAVPAFADDYSLELTPENTTVHWTLGDVLHTVNGTFLLKRGSIVFNTDTGKASGQVVVDAASGNSGNGSRDSRMHSSVLESKTFPEATFSARRIEGTLAVPGVSKVKLLGTFTIHGASHEIAMDIQATATADRIQTSMTFVIPYVAWGMKDPSNFLLKVDKTVRMSIDSTAALQITSPGQKR
jgi:polyisoprenoid-binding protein YceI